MLEWEVRRSALTEEEQERALSQPGAGCSLSLLHMHM